MFSEPERAFLQSQRIASIAATVVPDDLYVCF
jgi:hypothetical protein